MDRSSGAADDRPVGGPPAADPGDSGGGFSVLDGVAVVTGAAVASVHIRAVMRDGLTGLGWVLVWGTFTWVAVTAAGPFVFLVRRFVRRVAEYPKVGDWLWALLGLPWVLTAVMRSAAGGDGSGPRDELFTAGLTVGLTASSLIALAVVWTSWVMVPPEQAARAAALPWTNRVGLILSVAWPVQCGVGMVVIG
jgi:hypothetical protein